MSAILLSDPFQSVSSRDLARYFFIWKSAKWVVPCTDRVEFTRQHVDDVQAEGGNDGSLNTAVARDDVGL